MRAAAALLKPTETNGSASAPRAHSPHDRAQALSFVRQISIVWFVLDAFTHLSMELSYVLLTYLYNGASRAPAWLAPLSFIWREYGRADARWAAYDPTVLSLELLTVFIAGPLAAACAYGVLRRAPWRHVAVVVSACPPPCCCRRRCGCLRAAVTAAPHRLGRLTPFACARTPTLPCTRCGRSSPQWSCMAA